MSGETLGEVCFEAAHALGVLFESVGQTIGIVCLDVAHALEELSNSMIQTFGVVFDQIAESLESLAEILARENRHTLHRAFVAQNLRRKK